MVGADGLSLYVDRLLLLQKGGETVYFGDIGPDSRILVDYFARNGAPCPPDANREYDVVTNLLVRRS
jgi:hypothetical protein